MMRWRQLPRHPLQERILAQVYRGDIYWEIFGDARNLPLLEEKMKVITPRNGKWKEPMAPS